MILQKYTTLYSEFYVPSPLVLLELRAVLENCKEVGLQCWTVSPQLALCSSSEAASPEALNPNMTLSHGHTV